MTPARPVDVQVCLPGHGCAYYTPGAGQLVNAAIVVGPGRIDVAYAVVLGLLLGVAGIALIIGWRRRSRVGAPLLPSVLVGAGGLLAAVPPLVPAVAPAAALFGLASSACVGAGFLVLSGRMPRPLSLPLRALGVLRLLELPVAAAQFGSSSPMGSMPEDLLSDLQGAALVVAAVVLLVAGRGAMRWALLPPIACAIPLSIRLELLPFAAPVWVQLIGPASTIAVAALVSASPTQPPAPRASTLIGAVVLIAVPVAVVLGVSTTIDVSRHLVPGLTVETPAYGAEVAAWNRCMLLRGHVYASPMEQQWRWGLRDGGFTFPAPENTHGLAAGIACESTARLPSALFPELTAAARVYLPRS